MEREKIYKPKILTQEDIESGFKKASGSKTEEDKENKKETKHDFPNFWGSKKLTRQTKLEE